MVRLAERVLPLVRDSLCRHLVDMAVNKIMAQGLVEPGVAAAELHKLVRLVLVHLEEKAATQPLAAWLALRHWLAEEPKAEMAEVVAHGQMVRVLSSEVVAEVEPREPAAERFMVVTAEARYSGQAVVVLAVWGLD